MLLNLTIRALDTLEPVDPPPTMARESLRQSLIRKTTQSEAMHAGVDGERIWVRFQIKRDVVHLSHRYRHRGFDATLRFGSNHHQASIPINPRPVFMQVHLLFPEPIVLSRTTSPGLEDAKSTSMRVTGFSVG